MKKWKRQVSDTMKDLAERYENILIAAHSMGTLFALSESIKYEEKVKGLFLLAVPLKLFLKPSASVNSIKVILNRVSEDDPAAMAARGAYKMCIRDRIYGWSLFKAPFGEVYPDWSLSQLSMTFTISMVFFCLGGFVAGKLAAKLKPRYIIMLSGLLLLVGFFGVSRMNPDNSSSSRCV